MSNPGSGLETHKTVQMVLVDQENMGPLSQKAQKVAIYDSTGTPVDFTADADDTGADVLLTGYAAGSYSAISATDSVNEAIAKLAAVVTRSRTVHTLAQSGGNVAVDASLAATYDLALTASGWTISNPTNAVDGLEITLRLAQDATGSRTVSWGTAYDFGTTPGAVTLTTTASKVDVLKFHYVSALSKWVCVGLAKGD